MRKRESRITRGAVRDRRRSIGGGLEERREALHLAQVEIVTDRRCARPPAPVLLGMPVAAWGMHTVAVVAHSSANTANGGHIVRTCDTQP
jgi:hypothetical protein